MTVANRMTETQWMERVIDTAHLHGWLVAHFRPARTDRRWRTPMQGDPGFPDLALARRGRVIVAELKTDTGRVRADQVAWLEQLGSHGRLWRPRDWADVLTEITPKIGGES